MATAATPLSKANDLEVEISPSSKKKSGCKRCTVKSPRKRVAIIIAVTAVLAVVVGFLIGYFVPKPKKDVCVLKPSSGHKEGTRKDMHNTFEDLVNAEELEKEFR